MLPLLPVMIHVIEETLARRDLPSTATMFLLGISMLIDSLRRLRFLILCLNVNDSKGRGADTRPPKKTYKDRCKYFWELHVSWHGNDKNACF